MRRLLIAVSLLAALVVSACVGDQTTAIPTIDPNNATTEPTTAPNPELAEEDPAQATTESTTGAAADVTAEATADGTAALETAFAIQITGDTEATLHSENGGEVRDSVSGPSDGSDGLAAANPGTDAEGSNSSGQSVLNTPSSTLRILQFVDPDQRYLFELTLTDELAPGQYEIGINNVQTTIGDNVNQNQDGVPGSSSGAEATGVSGSAPANIPSGTQTSPTAQAASPADTNDPPANAPGGGVVERDELFAPTIAARLEVMDDEAASYNLVQSGTLRIETMSETSASGSFAFTLSPASDPAQTINVTGTFVDVPLT